MQAADDTEVLPGDLGAVLVTGASSGIGRAIALDLDAHAYRVFAGVRNRKDGAELKKAATGGLHPLTIDVSDSASIRRARGTVKRMLGDRGLVGLINNAGIGIGGPVETIPMEDFRKVIDVNLHGSVETTQVFLPLVRKEKGAIVFMGSIGGKVASPTFGAYNASKFAIEGVADALRREVLGQGIRVVVVEPGSIATPIWDKSLDATDVSQAKVKQDDELYGEMIERMRTEVRKTADRGIAPEKVAATVRRALSSSNPKTRYRVGRDATMMYRAQQLLGDKRFDKVMRKQLGLD